MTLDPPAVTIVITGERERERRRDRIRVDGVTEGVKERAPLRTMIDVGRGERRGKASPMVDETGEFTWQRRTERRQEVTVRFTYRGATSNALTL